MKGKISIYKIAAWVSGIILIGVALPILLIGKYNYPNSDDFRYGVETARVWSETHSLWQTILQAAEVVKETWWSWQGSFSAIFLMALQPDVFAEGTNLYAITPYIMVGSLIISELLLSRVVLVNYGKIDKHVAFTVTAIALASQILWVPDPVEAFFWYNGAIYYTFYYSVSLIFWAVLLSCMRTTGKKRLVYAGIGLLLGIFLGGGNMPTGLLTLEIMVILCLVAVLKKEKEIVYILPAAAALLVAYLINIAAPGNAQRQLISESMPALESIIASFREGIAFIASKMHLMTVVVVLALIPFLWKCTEYVKISYRYPVVFSALTLGLFSSQMTPTLYAQSYTGPHRLLDMIFYSFWIWLLGNIFYWLGWGRKHLSSVAGKVIGNLKAKQPKACSMLQRYKVVCLLAFWCVLGMIYVISLPAYGYTRTSTFGSYFTMKNGEAKQYAAEQEARLEILRDDSIKEVELTPLQVAPYVIFLDDIGSDPEDERNRYMAQYYGKDKVWIKE